MGVATKIYLSHAKKVFIMISCLSALFFSGCVGMRGYESCNSGLYNGCSSCGDYYPRRYCTTGCW